MDTRRIIINIAVPFLLFFVRWFVVTIGWRLSPNFLGKETCGFDKAKTFAMLGWDFTGVGLGFYLSALLSGESMLSMWSDPSADAGDGHLKILFSFCIFVVLYLMAVFVRFCLLEGWTGKNLSTVHRILYGLISWILGFAIMGSSSALAIRGGKLPPAPISSMQPQPRP